MKPSRAARLVTVLAPLVLLTGCVTVSPEAATNPAQTLLRSHVPDTAWATELGNVSPTGERSLDSALRLFAMAYGPIPGVDAVPATSPRVEGTLARRAIRGHYDELSSDQKAAVDAWLAPEADASTVDIGPVSGGTRPVV